MPGDIALVGGDEFNPGCQDMDREIMRASGQDPARVLVVPTAQVRGPVKAANDGVQHFSSLGGNASPLMVLDKAQANDARLLQVVEGAGVIYFCGGSPDHLLETLRGSRLLEAILAAVAEGTVLAGSSAGAMVLGSMMRRPPNHRWAPALGVVPGIAVLPHHQGRDPSETSSLLQQAPPGLTLLGIDAQAGCLGRLGSWRVVGSGNVTVYRGGQWTVYHPGERLPNDV
jgi:cyanophycinase